MAGFLDHTSEEVRKGEFISGVDNKMRYFRPIRTSVYRVLKEALEKHIEEKHLYLCMESPTVWEDVFGIKHMTSQRLKKRLDDACIEKFPRLSRGDIQREDNSRFHLEKNY
jgi:spore photoproduct lyase